MEKENFKNDFIKRAIQFSVNILRFAQKIKSQPVFWPVMDQLIRSATSIGANVIEARASSSKQEYLRYFQIALKSGNEAKYWLILIQETLSDFKNRAEELHREADQLTRILAASILTLKGKR